MSEAMLRWSAPEDGYYEYTSWFDDQVDERIENGQNVLAVFTGPLGSGKTWSGAKLCEKKNPSFTIEDTVFNTDQFWDVMRKPGPAWVLWDEPNRGLSNRRWYDELNQAVTLFIQTSTRFRGKNILFCLPSFDLLDKNVRRVTLFEARMVRPGLSKIYKLEPNGFGTPEIWKQLLGQLETGKPSSEWQKAYPEKRLQFHETDYPDENPSSIDGPAKTKRQREIERVLAVVKATPERFLAPRVGHDGKEHLSASKIAALCDCTEHVASMVREKVEDSHPV
jgi:hypothetical protein